jgi:hypothetical protein
MKKSAETRANFKKYGHVASPLKKCRQDGKMPGVVGLIAMSKSQNSSKMLIGRTDIHILRHFEITKR